jgi:TRAP-type C4-dicarboxylate transport system permease small subunit
MRALDRCVAAAVRGAGWLVLPLALLLFAQWPLRELVQAGSREANDLAQIVFALYVAVAVTAATRADAHLATDIVAHSYPARARSLLQRAASLLIAMPASAFVLWSAAAPTWRSLLQLERFPETLDPGYFALRAAAFLLAAFVLVQAILDGVAPRDRRAS